MRRTSIRVFPFGFGLSYTTFEYSNLKLVPGHDTNGPVVTAEFDLANTGPRAGAEVAQLYVHQENPSLPRPLKELKGFKKVFLNPGEKQTVSIPLDLRAFAFYDPAKAGWVAETDNYEVLVGKFLARHPPAGQFSPAENHGGAINRCSGCLAKTNSQ